MSDLRDRIARVLFVDATTGTGYLWDGTERQEVAHREAAYSLADVICGFIAEDRRELIEVLRTAREALRIYGHAVRCKYDKPGESAAYPLGACTCGYFTNLITIDAALAKEEGK